MYSFFSDRGDCLDNKKNQIRKNALPNNLRELMISNQKALRAAVEIISNASIQLKESLSKVVLNTPKIDWNSFYEKLSKDCESNTKYGWCLSAEMAISTYRDIAKEDDNQDTRDEFFIHYFELNDNDLLRREQNYITSSADNGWKDFYEDCFFMINNGKYKAVVIDDGSAASLP